MMHAFADIFIDIAQSHEKTKHKQLAHGCWIKPDIL